jgi:hypothetical protein
MTGFLQTFWQSLESQETNTLSILLFPSYVYFGKNIGLFNSKSVIIKKNDQDVLHDIYQ